MVGTSKVLKKRIKSTLRRVQRSGIYAAALLVPDELVARVVRSTQKGTSERSLSVLVAAPGNGNIGDQAMLEAYLAATPGSVMIYEQGEGLVRIPTEHQGRVRTVASRNLIRGLPGFRLAAVARFAKSASRAKAVTLVGADLMDGLYNTNASLARASVLRVASLQGTRTNVLGFSWSPDYVATAAGALKRTQSETAIYARDPLSYARLKEAGVTQTKISADVVFTTRDTESHSEFDRWQRDGQNDGKYAVVNASGLLASRADQKAEYGRVIAAIRDQGHNRIVFLPHVIRKDHSDAQAVSEVHSAFGTENDLLIMGECTPAQVRGIARNASVVFTGRMHLAIMSLGQGTPAMTISTQGKVEGLYEMFGLSSWALPSDGGFASLAGELLRSADLDVVRRQILTRLPKVIELAEANFESR